MHQMDLENFKELFEYNHQVRKNYLLYIQGNISWEDIIKNHETAWLSMKGTLLHIICVEDLSNIQDPNNLCDSLCK